MMKNFRTLFAICTFVLLTACGTSNTTTTTTGRRGDMDTSKTRTNTNTRVSGNTNSNTNTNTNTTTTTNTSGTRGASNTQQKSAEEMSAMSAAQDAYKQKMATDLSLTAAQMNTYEANWNAENAKYKRTNRNNDMTLYERVEAQDKIFKNILNEADFAKYQAWVRDNPEKI